MRSVLTKGRSCGGLTTIRQWRTTNRWIVWCKSSCVCLCGVCVYVYAKWFHDVLVSAMWWQQEDVWGNKKKQTVAYVASRTHTYTPPCPKAKTKGYSPHNSTVSRETYFFWLLWRY